MLRRQVLIHLRERRRSVGSSRLCGNIPEFVAGENRFCTILMAAFQGLLIGKLGADGCYGIGIRECELAFGSVSKQDVLEQKVLLGFQPRLKMAIFTFFTWLWRRFWSSLRLESLKCAKRSLPFHYQKVFNTVNVQTGKFLPCVQVRAAWYS